MRQAYMSGVENMGQFAVHWFALTDHTKKYVN